MNMRKTGDVYEQAFVKTFAGFFHEYPGTPYLFLPLIEVLSKEFGTFFDELFLLMTPGRKTGEHTPRVNSFN